MEKSKLARFIDNFVIFLLTFIVSFIFIKTKIANNYITIIFSFVASFLLFNILLYFQNRNLKNLSIKSSEKQNIQDYNYTLRKMSERSQLTFFKNMLKEKDIKKSPHGLVIENKVLFYLALNLDYVTPANIFSIYSKAKNMRGKNIQEVCVVCNKISEDIKPIISSLDIKFTLFTPTETYAMLKQFNYFPPLPEKQSKIKPKLIKEAFMKQKGKNFIKCSLVIYIFSLFVPFTKYYLISASILLIFGITCLCFGKETQVIEPLSKQLLLPKNTI